MMAHDPSDPWSTTILEAMGQVAQKSLCLFVELASESWENWHLSATRVFHFQICFTQRIDEFDSTFGCVSPLEILLNS